MPQGLALCFAPKPPKGGFLPLCGGFLPGYLGVDAGGVILRSKGKPPLGGLGASMGFRDEPQTAEM